MTAAGKHSLKGIGILEPMSEAGRQKLESLCRWREFTRDEQIIDRDSDTGDVFFVVRGKVRVVNYSYTGREVSYDDLGAGGVFGELSAIDGAPRSANVVALNNTTVAAMSPEQFRQSLAENPEFALSVMIRLVEIIRGSTDRIMDLSTLGAYSRVYAEILRLARENAGDDNSSTIRPVPVHSDVASRAGTTRETVARALSDLSRKGIAKREDDALLVSDINQLEEIVEGPGGN
ncbi:MAG: Crp/Fnr family transcriptional regulator [Alphaproteobacteria bacterium]|nr:Crp/Fnr family transcriptional regulator [Alphaproteobacteria bacterium]